MGHTPGNLRRTPLALATALVLVAGTLALGLNVASAAPAIRKFGATLVAPTCIKKGTPATFTATFKNDMLSNQKLGSAKIDSEDNANAFRGITGISVNLPHWTAAPDHANADGVILKADSSTYALIAGQSVSVTFTATAPSLAIVKTWATFAWQNTNYTTSFSRTTPNPMVTVSDNCVGPPTTIAFVDGPPTDTAAGAFMASPPVTVQVTDGTTGLNNQTVVLTSSSIGTSAGLDPSSSTSQLTDTNGIATFSSLKVGTLAGPYTLTASSGGLTPDTRPFNIVAGAPIVTFSQQPTDTLISSNLLVSEPMADVKVTAKDQFGNSYSGTASLTLTFNPTTTALPQLNGMVPQALVGGGATFSGLTISSTNAISPTGTGYGLHVDVPAVGAADSTNFAIANTLPSSCATTDCTAQFPNGGGTVTAPPGTTLIIENNNLGCGGAIDNPIAGTLTIIPSLSGPGIVDITFVDPFAKLAPFTPGRTYPFCKDSTAHPNGAEVPPCATPASVGCLVSQKFDIGDPVGSGTYDLTTVLRITSDDPHTLH